MARNIELKARCADLDAAAGACRRLGARFEWTRRQVDTYFRVAEGRLKLRVSTPGEALLVSYRRADEAAARDSQYELRPVEDAEAVLGEFTARHGILARVAKTRTLYLLGHIRIHLDRVEGLGTFIEFEAVMDDQHEDAPTRERLAALRRAFGIGDEDLLGESYAELVTCDQNKRTPTRPG